PTVLHHIVDSDPVPPTIDNFAPPGSPEGPSQGLIPLVDPRSQPQRPHEEPATRSKPRRISEPIIAAVLVHRVEPVYPALAIQPHQTGHVELRAIIAVDGSIQSLQVVRGSPFFIQSALDAVRQWRYRPTYLNGEPVEVDTYITVDYTLQH